MRAALCLLVAAVAACVSPSDAQQQPIAGGDAGVAQGPSPWPIDDPEEDVARDVVCWNRLPDVLLARGFDLAGMAAAADAARTAGDDAMLELLRKRLTELIGADPRRAMAVLELALAATEHDVIAFFAEALAESDAVRDPAVRARLVEVAEDHSDTEHQGAALAMLEAQDAFDARTRERLTRVALDTPDRDNRLYAIKTIGTVMERDCQTRGCDAYMTALVDAGRGSRDAFAERLAVEMLSNAPAPMPETVIDHLGDAIANGPMYDTRDLATLALAQSGRPERALELFREMFARAGDFCTRVSIFRYAAAAAGPNALPLMREFARTEPELADDYAKIAALYDSGVVAFDRIAAALFDEIHLECATMHDEGHDHE